MKSFLIASILLMTAAGIYGTFDLSMDVRNGTLIKYDDGDEAPAGLFARDGRFLTRPNNVHVAQRSEKKEKAKPTLINSFSELDISDFSRAMPVTYEVLLDNLGQPDSLKNTDVSAAIADTIKAINEKKIAAAKDSSAALVKEERKFKLALYSRGKPRPYRPETAEVQIDTSKVK